MEKYQKLFCYFTLSVFAVIIFYQKKLPATENDSDTWTCSQDLLRNSSMCYPECAQGTFALPGMTSCHPWLNCNSEITLISPISFSVVKTVYLARWQSHKVVLSVLSSKLYQKDFQQNLFMVKSLASHHQVVQLLGYCYYYVVTKYHELGSALNANYHLMHLLKSYNTIKMRLNLCISYVSVLEFLHTSPVGIRVMCDSNTLEKTLSQYLLTADLKVILNDLDATPVVDNITKKGIHCGNQMLTGTFVAPEQLWPYPNEKYDPTKMPSYDEKTDIWKIPDICNWFLGNSSDSDIVKYKLFSLHKQCKNTDPSERPNASFVLKMYQKVLNELT